MSSLCATTVKNIRPPQPLGLTAKSQSIQDIQCGLHICHYTPPRNSESGFYTGAEADPSQAVQCRLMCRFSDAGNDGAIDALERPASEKRQGRKSRSVVQRRCGVRYGDLAAGLELMRLDGSRCGGWFAVNRGWLHRGEGAIGTLHDGICGANTGQCRGRMRACLRPAASQRGWQVSELLSIGGDGIMRCRS